LGEERGVTSGANGEHGVPVPPGYRLVSKLGEGGRGIVFQAIHIELDQPFAIKFFRPPGQGASTLFDWRTQTEVHSCCRREMQHMQLLRHPGIVQVFATGQRDGWSWLVMEYVPGGALRRRLRPGRPWPLARTSALLAQIADALAYCHRVGVLHLDLKPENILLRDGRWAKLSDFGLSQSSFELLDDPGALCAQGTCDYCAPEQRFGLPVDERSDVFSLAAIAYELLAGCVPGRVYVPVVRRNPTVSPQVDAVLAQGLARDPDDRFGSVREFWHFLRPALHAPAGLRALMSVVWPFPKSWRRRR